VNDTVVKVESFSANVRKLGDWTDSGSFEVRARNGYALLDLRSPRIPEGDIVVRVQASRSAIKLLVPEDAVIDQWDLRITGRGTVKDWESQGKTGRRIRLVGEIHNGEVRIARGGIAILTAMFSKEFIEDCVRAHREGGRVTVHDPAAL